LRIPNCSPNPITLQRGEIHGIYWKRYRLWKKTS
jgi:hypothetical protein